MGKEKYLNKIVNLFRNKLKYIKKSFFYVVNYKKTVFLIAIFSLLGSVFQGFSLGLIIPFFQSFSGNSDISSIIPIFEKLQDLFISDNLEESIIKIFTFLFIMIFLKNLFNYLRTVLTNKVVNNIKRDLQVNLFNSISEANLFFYDNMRSGSTVSSIGVYTDNIASFIYIILNSFLFLSRLFVYLIILFLISVKFTLVILIIFSFSMPFLKKVLYIIKSIGLNIVTKVAEMHNQMVDVFYRLRLVKIFGTKDYENSRFEKYSTTISNLNNKASIISNLLQYISEISLVFLILLALIFSIYILHINIQIFLPAIVAYLVFFINFFNEGNSLLKSLSKAFSIHEYFNSYEKLLTNAKNKKEISGNVAINNFSKSIDFRNMSFSYNNEKIVINNIDLTIKKGSFTAIVGNTGSGKTTIINLLCGLYTPTTGDLLIDGVNIHNVDLKNWRKRIGYISQDLYIFNDSIKNNIKYGNFSVSDSEIIEACKIAQIDSFVTSLPDGYDTQIGENGAKLSGGQKQRLAIARAIVRKPDILILDEATSSLDSETEKRIQGVLEKTMKGRTVIAVAHRLSTIYNADEIIILENGRILDKGKHEELLGRNEYYKKIYNIGVNN